MGTEHATVRLGFDRSSFSRGLSQARGAFMSFKGALGAIGIGFGLGALTAHLSRVRAFAEGIQDTAASLGVTTKFLQEFQGVTYRSGGSAESANKALTKLNGNIEDIRNGTSEAGKTFKAMGLSAVHANGSFKTTEELIYDIADAFKKSNDQAVKTAWAMDLFGKSGAEMVLTLNRGSNGIKEMGAQVRKLTDDDLANIDKFTAALKNLSNEAMVAGGKLISGTAVPVAEMKSWWDRTQDELVDMIVPSLLGDKISATSAWSLGRRYNQAFRASDAGASIKASGVIAPRGASGGVVNYSTMDAMQKAGMSSGLIAGLASRQRMIEYASSHRAGLFEQSQGLRAKGAAFDAMSLKSRDLRSIGTPDNFTAKRVNVLEAMGIDMGILAKAATQTGVKIIPQNSD